MQIANSTSVNRRMAMLIDGDNAQPSLMNKMIAEVGKYGSIIIRRIYGDWTTSNMGGWKDNLQTHAIQPIQQFRYTIGKNATDSAMIIDAMDILYSGEVEGFCLVSSDSDYTRLATRIREKGIFVMGMGKKNTPRAFVNACDVFVYTENLVSEESLAKRSKPSSRSKKDQHLLQNLPRPIPFHCFAALSIWLFRRTAGHFWEHSGTTCASSIQVSIPVPMASASSRSSSAGIPNRWRSRKTTQRTGMWSFTYE